MARDLFGAPAIENLWEDIHYLTMMIDGIGYSYSLADVLDESPAWLRWAVSRLQKARKAISDARRPK